MGEKKESLQAIKRYLDKPLKFDYESGREGCFSVISCLGCLSIIIALVIGYFGSQIPLLLYGGIGTFALFLALRSITDDYVILDPKEEVFRGYKKILFFTSSYKHYNISAIKNISLETKDTSKDNKKRIEYFITIDLFDGTKLTSTENVLHEPYLEKFYPSVEKLRNYVLAIATLAGGIQIKYCDKIPPEEQLQPADISEKRMFGAELKNSWKNTCMGIFALAFLGMLFSWLLLWSPEWKWVFYTDIAVLVISLFLSEITGEYLLVDPLKSSLSVKKRFFFSNYFKELSFREYFKKVSLEKNRSNYFIVQLTGPEKTMELHKNVYGPVLGNDNQFNPQLKELRDIALSIAEVSGCQIEYNPEIPENERLQPGIKKTKKLPEIKRDVRGKTPVFDVKTDFSYNPEISPEAIYKEDRVIPSVPDIKSDFTYNPEISTELIYEEERESDFLDSEKKCPFCKGTVPLPNKFCIHCGYKL